MPQSHDLKQASRESADCAEQYYIVARTKASIIRQLVDDAARAELPGSLRHCVDKDETVAWTAKSNPEFNDEGRDNAKRGRSHSLTRTESEGGLHHSSPDRDAASLLAIGSKKQKAMPGEARATEAVSLLAIGSKPKCPDFPPPPHLCWSKAPSRSYPPTSNGLSST